MRMLSVCSLFNRGIFPDERLKDAVRAAVNGAHRIEDINPQSLMIRLFSDEELAQIGASYYVPNSELVNYAVDQAVFQRAFDSAVAAQPQGSSELVPAGTIQAKELPESIDGINKALAGEGIVPSHPLSKADETSLLSQRGVRLGLENPFQVAGKLKAKLKPRHEWGKGYELKTIHLTNGKLVVFGVYDAGKVHLAVKFEITST